MSECLSSSHEQTIVSEWLPKNHERTVVSKLLPGPEFIYEPVFVNLSSIYQDWFVPTFDRTLERSLKRFLNVFHSRHAAFLK